MKLYWHTEMSKILAQLNENVHIIRTDKASTQRYFVLTTDSSEL